MTLEMHTMQVGTVGKNALTGIRKVLVRNEVDLDLLEEFFDALTAIDANVSEYRACHIYESPLTSPHRRPMHQFLRQAARKRVWFSCVPVQCCQCRPCCC